MLLVMARFDADNSGSISDDELANYHLWSEALVVRPHRTAPRTPLPHTTCLAWAPGLGTWPGHPALGLTFPECAHAHPTAHRTGTLPRFGAATACRRLQQCAQQLLL